MAAGMRERLFANIKGYVTGGTENYRVGAEGPTLSKPIYLRPPCQPPP